MDQFTFSLAVSNTLQVKVLLVKSLAFVAVIRFYPLPQNKENRQGQENVASRRMRDVGGHEI